MGSKHHRLSGLEQERLLRDFRRLGLSPDTHYTEFTDEEFYPEDHSQDGWIMFSPKDASEIIDMLGRPK